MKYDERRSATRNGMTSSLTTNKIDKVMIDSSFDSSQLHAGSQMPYSDAMSQGTVIGPAGHRQNLSVSDAEFAKMGMGNGSVGMKQSVKSSSSNSSFGHFWKKENINQLIKRATELDQKKKE